MGVLLRITAALSLLWAIGLFFFKPGLAEGEQVNAALANGLAIAHAGFAYLFWRAGANPPGERTAIYTALLVLALRAANATYEVLYLLEGRVAIFGLIEMAACIALFVGVLNTLPATLQAGAASAPSQP